MSNRKTDNRPAAVKAPKILGDEQLDRVVGGARPSSPKPIIIIGG